MSKYSAPMGDPLDLLAEECAELIKEIMKWRRFGPEGVKEWVEQGNVPPRGNVIQEIGDVLAVIDLVVKEPRFLINREAIDAARDKKHQRLKELFG